MNRSAAAVFLSYASQDAEAAARLCQALRDAGVEVWFDKSELRGGDTWDASIRQQIRGCALFLPIISSNTNARGEGYFRREWKLAVDRMQEMADDQPFLLPVVVDDTAEASARVPDAFRARQWTRCREGVPPAGFVERVRGLLEPSAPSSAGQPHVPAPGSPRKPPAHRRRMMALGMAAIIAVGAGGWAANRYLRNATVVPYSAEDRRMTFAVLPLRPPPGDAAGAHVAASLSEAAYASQERRKLWARVASPRSVQDALAHHVAAKDIANALGVHFLIRGTLAPAKEGYEAEFVVADGASDRVLRTRKLAVAPGMPALERSRAMDEAMGWLTYGALTAEVERARGLPLESMDVRDLAFRAYVDWNLKKQNDDEKAAYTSASKLLQRALALDPEDLLALNLTARVNLCDCVNDWSHNAAEQQRIGEAALERYLEKDSQSVSMQMLKAELHALRGRHEESLLLVERIVQEHPDATDWQSLKAYNLLKLGKPKEAWAVLEPVVATDRHWQTLSLAAATQYTLGRYDAAAQMAREAKAQMDRKDLASNRSGTVALTLVAAEARLGKIPRAKQAMADFHEGVRGVDTIAAVRKWMHPMAELAGSETLFEGLRLAGVPD